MSRLALLVFLALPASLLSAPGEQIRMTEPRPQSTSYIGQDVSGRWVGVIPNDGYRIVVMFIEVGTTPPVVTEVEATLDMMNGTWWATIPNDLNINKEYHISAALYNGQQNCGSDAVLFVTIEGT